MTSLKLQRIEHFQINSTTSKCATLIRADKKTGLGQLVVADSSGQVNVFSPDESGTFDRKTFTVTKPITVVQSDQSVRKEKPRILIAHDKQISLYSTKGKQLRNYESNVDGQIEAFFCNTQEIYLVTGHIYQKVVKTKEEEFLLCPDIIADLLVLFEIDSLLTPLVALACRDRFVRVLKDGVVSYEVGIDSCPVCLLNGLTLDSIVYGTIDGTLGMIKLYQSKGVVCWQIPSHGHYGSVLTMQHFDLTRDEKWELIVAYENGVVEVYAYDEFGQPTPIYETNTNTRLTAMVVGLFSNPVYPEVICVTFTGSIFGLTTEPIKEHLDRGHAENKTQRSQEKLLQKLQREVEQLEAQVTQLRTQQRQIAPTVLALTPLDLIHSFHLDSNLSAYCLHIESAVPLDHVLVQSDCSIDLLDVAENTAIKSVTVPSSKTDENAVLVTYRFQANTTHLELRLRTIEGQYGTLQIYVVPSGNQTPCVCNRLQFPIRPLSLHRRTHEFNEEPDRPVNRLTLTGKFSLAEMHQWLVFCLPDTPERPSPIAETSLAPGEDGELATAKPTEFVRLVYECTFLHTQLECRYERNQATFRSDNLSTIAILKDILTNEATKRKIHLTMDLDIHPDNVEYMLRLIQPRLESLLSLARKVHLIEPLQELVASQTQGASQSTSTRRSADPQERGDNPLPSSLPADCAAIWRNAAELRKAYQDQPCVLERLYGCIIDLYIDKYRFKGIDVKSRAPGLLDLLHRYDFHKILQYFNEP